MNEDINKFKVTTKEVIRNLETLNYVLEAKQSCIENETVSKLLDVYGDTVDRLKDAFDTLRAEAGSKLIKDL